MKEPQSKTIRAWLNTLPNPYRKWAFDAHKKEKYLNYKLTDKEDYLYGAIIHGFVWDGLHWDFFDSLHSHLFSGKSLKSSIQLAEKHISINSTSHPLIIKKITKLSRGKKVHTWQFSKNKKVSNHLYNGKSTRDKQLAQFIEDIKSGNYEII